MSLRFTDYYSKRYEMYKDALGACAICVTVGHSYCYCFSCGGWCCRECLDGGRDHCVECRDEG